MFQKYFVLVCSDSHTIAGLPGPIHEGLSILKKVITLALFLCFPFQCKSDCFDRKKNVRKVF